MKKLFAALSATLASIPGLSVILSGLGAPPGYKLLFGGIIEAFGTLVLFILYVNRKRIQRAAKHRITKTAIILACCSCVSIGLYFLLYQHCVVRHSTHGTVYFPLYTTGRIAQLITQDGTRYAVLDHFGHHSIITELHSMPSYTFAISLTTFVLMLVYQSISNALAAAFGLLSFYVEVPMVTPETEGQPTGKTERQSSQGRSVRQRVAKKSGASH